MHESYNSTNLVAVDGYAKTNNMKLEIALKSTLNISKEDFDIVENLTAETLEESMAKVNQPDYQEIMGRMLDGFSWSVSGVNGKVTRNALANTIVQLLNTDKDMQFMVLTVLGIADQLDEEYMEHLQQNN